MDEQGVAPVATSRGAHAAPDLHPSAPLPVQLGLPGIGTSLRRPFGDTDLEVFPLGLSGSVFGWTAQTGDSESILNRYLELGGNYVDTADSYAAGRSEHIIGTWMAHRGIRDEMIIGTKIGRHPDNPGLGPVSMVRAVEASLERLQTDYIDVLYFHDDDPRVPLEESLGTAQWLIESGKVRYLAANGYAPERLVQARILAAGGYPRFSAIGTHLSLVHRSDYEGMTELVARGQKLAVIPHLALEGGYLSGKYRGKSSPSLSGIAERLGKLVTRSGPRTLATLDRIAQAHSVTPTTIALAWVLGRRGITAPVVSANSAAHVDAIMGAVGIDFTASEGDDLDRLPHS